MAPSSAYEKTPASAIAPPAPHAASTSSGVSSRCATLPGDRKMPAPTIPPITTMVASNGPSARLKSAASCQLPAHGLRLTAYGLRLTAYGLRLTAYSLRLTAHTSQSSHFPLTSPQLTGP